MPPKKKITREKILIAALGLVRAGGEANLNSRDLALALGCSTMPVFSAIGSMDEVKRGVLGGARKICEEYIEKGRRTDPTLGAYTGYISFAEEEPQLFRFLFLTGDDGAVSPFDFGMDKVKFDLDKLLPRKVAARIYLEMWIFCHGIAVVTATDYVRFSPGEVETMLTDCLEGLLKKFGVNS